MKHEWFRDTLGAMERAELSRHVRQRMETRPNYRRYPELEELYPERLEFLRGFARGAECTLTASALHSYLAYRQESERWYRVFQMESAPAPRLGQGCSGVLLVGTDGILAGQNVDSGAPSPPGGYRHRQPRRSVDLRQGRVRRGKLVVIKPRTGYIEDVGVGNERGVAYLAGASSGVWLDEPFEDTWPIMEFPFLRFAESISHLAALQRRYVLFSIGKGNNSIYADLTGNAMVVEKSNRRIGIRMIGKEHVLWCTEGHFESPEMYAYLRAQRLEYVARMGRHLGCGDLQYAADNAVRFAHIGELCHAPWGRGYAHLRRILTDHAPFPRATCRHGGPDTDPYDTSVTQMSWILDFTRNRKLERSWTPWKTFCCEVPEQVTQYPARQESRVSRFPS